MRLGLVPRARVELAQVALLVFETSASTIPPPRHTLLSNKLSKPWF